MHRSESVSLSQHVALFPRKRPSALTPSSFLLLRTAFHSFILLTIASNVIKKHSSEPLPVTYSATFPFGNADDVKHEHLSDFYTAVNDE